MTILRASLVIVFAMTAVVHAVEPAAIERINSTILSPGESLSEMLERDVSTRLTASNRRSTAAWQSITSREHWERLRNQTIDALRKSLGNVSTQQTNVRIHIVRELKADGHIIRNIVYESRPGLLVTANLYVPAESASSSMPGILISHSHHSPKSQGELQDMGALWARAGCLVLVPDHLGHGERRQHPFASAKDYADTFQVGRQDYHFRFNTAIQLYLAGESLMGWMAHDLMRGVDVLLAQTGIDPSRMALLGAVAGGGDPAGVTVALDTRITVVAPFNFGGPQPETRYPLPDDAEERFDYAGGGSWESTRNLRRSARDGFLPWLIVGSVAPRGLIHAHEFSWDRERDPVWRRYEKIYSFYDAQDRLGFTHGYGLLRQDSSQASHCNNIGKPHRQRIHEYLERQWNIQVDEDHPITRYSASDLACLPLKHEVLYKNRPLHELTRDIAANRSASFLVREQSGSPAERLQSIREAWAQVLGDVTPHADLKVESRGDEQVEKLKVERWLITGERDIRLPMLQLIPDHGSAKIPVTLVVTQQGKQEFLKRRSKLVAQLLEHSAICLVDVRGTGETRADSDRGRRSADTGLAASELMLGETLLGARLRDVRTVMKYLRGRPEFNQIALLGDSLAPVNGPGINVNRPLETEQPHLAEPSGPILALLAGLFEDERMLIVARGGLIDYRSLFDSQFVHVPFDVIVPGAATIGDLPYLAQIVNARHTLHISDLIDGLNRPAITPQLAKRYGELAMPSASDDEIAKWIINHLGQQ